MPNATATLIASPFARAKEQARERVLQEQQAQKQAEAEKALELQRSRQAAKQAYLDNDVAKFVESFAIAVAKRGTERNWKESALDLAERYVEALTSHEDVEVPKVDPSMALIIHDAFVIGMQLYVNRSQRVNIPSDYFVGQRQDWYAEQLAKKVSIPRLPGFGIRTVS